MTSEVGSRSTGNSATGAATAGAGNAGASPGAGAGTGAPCGNLRTSFTSTHVVFCGCASHSPESEMKALGGEDRLPGWHPSRTALALAYLAYSNVSQRDYGTGWRLHPVAM